MDRFFARFRRSLTDRPPVVNEVADDVTTMPAGIAEPVRIAAADLDRYAPGWDAVIDLDRLVMLDCETCILGQLTNAAFGPFRKLRTGSCAYDDGHEILRRFTGRVHWDGAFSQFTGDWQALINHRRDTPQDAQA